MIRLILFDIDGTLVRTGGAGAQAFERTFADEFGIRDATRTLSFAGRTDTSLVREGFKTIGVDPTKENFVRFFRTYSKWLARLLPELKGEACPGVVEFLDAVERLSPAPCLGLLTGNVRAGAELKLRHYNLWTRFQFGAFGDDHEDRNTLACIAHQRGRERLGSSLKGDEILVIGDTPLDVACANAIQARMLAVATGGHTIEELRACGPTWVCGDLLGICAEEYCR